jgi:flagellin-like hook-associated protein FlgL
LDELAASNYSIQNAETKLNASVSQLRSATNILSRAAGVAQQAIQALDATERNALAIEVESLLASLQDIANSSSAGAFLYGGTRTDNEPYRFGPPVVEGGPLQVEYLGADHNSKAYVGQELTLDTHFAGNKIFADPLRAKTILLGDSGATIGSGTDTIIGRATLQVRHAQSTYLGGSGVAAGLSSQVGDTIIGPAGVHTLEINDTSGTGASGTISLNGGPRISFTNADTDLEIIGPTGQKIYLDTTAITPGFNGTVDVVADGTVSVDGGLSTHAIVFGQQTIVDSTSGRFTNIDTSGIDQAADDYLEFPETADVFQVLHELAQDLRNSRQLDHSQLTEALDRRLGQLRRLSDHVLEIVGQQSASLQTLSQLQIRVQDLELNVETQLNNLQSTDIPEAVLRLKNEQSLLEYTYAITAQITSQGLLDFLR